MTTRTTGHQDSDQHMQAVPTNTRIVVPTDPHLDTISPEDSPHERRQRHDAVTLMNPPLDVGNYGEPISAAEHTLHAVLTLGSLGLWAPVWAFRYVTHRTTHQLHPE